MLFRQAAYIEGYNETVFRDISINIEEQTDSWSLSVLIEFANNTKSRISGTVQLNIVDIKSTDAVTLEANSDGEFVFQKTLKISKVKKQNVTMI